MSRISRAFLRAVATVGVAILTSWALYVIAINVFLSTPLFEKVVDFDPEMLDVRFQRAWSIIPGRIHGERVQIRSSDSNVQWVVRIDEVDFSIALTSLARRQFHIEKARGTGVTFWARRKRPAPELTDDLARTLPPIPGFGRLPIRPPEPSGPERWNDKEYNLFTIHLEDTIAQNTTDVWVDDIRLRGHMRVVGSFFLKPIREAQVGPNEVSFAPGAELSLKGRTVATNLGGKVRMTIDSFDPRTTDGEMLLHHLSATADIRADIPDVNTLPGLDESAVHGEAHVPRLALTLDHGVLQPDATAEIQAPALTWSSKDLAAKWGATVKTARDDPARLKALVDLDGVQVDRKGTRLFEGGRVRGSIDTPPLDLTDPSKGAHAMAKVEKLAMPSPRAIADLAPAITAGAANAEGEAEAWLDQHRARGRVTVRTRDVAIDGGDLHVATGFVVEAKTDTFDWQTKKLRNAHVRVRANHVLLGWLSVDRTLKSDDLVVTADSPLLDLDRPGERFDVTAKGKIVTGMRVGARDTKLLADGDVDVSATVVGLAPETKTIRRLASQVTIANVKGTLREGFTAPDFLVPLVRIDVVADDLDVSAPKLSKTDLHVTAKDIRMPNVRALDALLPKSESFVIETGTVRADADVHMERDRARGKITVDLAKAEMRFASTRLAGNFRLDVPIKDYDRQNERLDLAGTTITLRDVWARGSSADTTHWNGFVTLRTAGLCFDEGGGFGAQASLHFDDAKPILAIAVGDDLPGFLADLVRAPQLHGDMTVSVGTEAVGLRDVNLAGGDIRLWGGYGKDAKAKDGGFIVKKGPLAAGVGVGDKDSSVHVFGLDAWLVERTQVAGRVAACPAVAR